jgi:putative acetyltransferase
MRVALEYVVRAEQPGDEPAIYDVTRRAFEGLPYADGTEQDIVNALRRHGALAVSLVAEHEGRIVGHVAFSPAVTGDGSLDWYTLGPVSVEPALQRQGIGKALVRRGLSHLHELHAAGCIVLGDVGYYSQFGFVPTPAHAPAGVPAEHFMVLRLNGPLPTGRLDFHRDFYPAG